MIRNLSWSPLRTPGILLAVAVAFLITPPNANASTLVLTACITNPTTSEQLLSFAFNCTDNAGANLTGSMSQSTTSTSDTIHLNPLTVTNNTGAMINTDTITIKNDYLFPFSGKGTLSAAYDVVLKSNNGALVGESVDATSFATTVTPDTVDAGEFDFTPGILSQASGTHAKTITTSVSAGTGTLTGSIIISNLGNGDSLTFPATFEDTDSTVPEPSSWTMMLIGLAGLGIARYRAAMAS